MNVPEQVCIRTQKRSRLNLFKRQRPLRHTSAGYGETSSSGYDIRGPILNIYKYSRVHSKVDRINGKLLNAHIDLELTYLFMMKDSLLAGGTHNRLHDTGKTAVGSVLDDFELFSGKLDILYALSALFFPNARFLGQVYGSAVSAL